VPNLSTAPYHDPLFHRRTQADVELRADSLCVGTYVTVVVAAVPAAAAEAALALGGAAPGVPQADAVRR
jgi:hypothetical protein